MEHIRKHTHLADISIWKHHHSYGASMPGEAKEIFQLHVRDFFLGGEDCGGGRCCWKSYTPGSTNIAALGYPPWMKMYLLYSPIKNGGLSIAMLVYQRVGGFNYLFFNYHPENWEDEAILTNGFSTGLKPPTRDDFLPKVRWNTIEIAM